jgi:hypothetical protein
MSHCNPASTVSINLSNVAAAPFSPVPTNFKELRSFMGFCGYYRKFIKNFSKLAKCLHKLTEKGRKFEWTNECQLAFEELKNRLVSSPILAHPDFSFLSFLDR